MIVKVALKFFDVTFEARTAFKINHELSKRVGGCNELCVHTQYFLLLH